MSRLVWDELINRRYETGIDRCALFVKEFNGYSKGVPWNGITSVNESPSGAEPSAQYADDIKYSNLLSTEEFNGTIEAYTYPDEFGECDGSVALLRGIRLSQQKKKRFGFCYRSRVGNHLNGIDYGYKLHIIYNALATASEKAYTTINDSPEAITFSWSFSTDPVSVEGHKSAAHIIIDSAKVLSTELGLERLVLLESELYGTDETEPRLLSIPEIFDLFGISENPRIINGDEVYY